MSIARRTLMVYSTTGAGNRHFCDLLARLKDVINVEKNILTPKMQDLAYRYQAKDGTDRLHKLRKQQNFVFLVWYYAFSILITSFTLANKLQKRRFYNT